MQKTILLVDDDEEEFYIIKMALDMAAINYQCVWANGLEEATKLVNGLRPDFIFIDINMPRYNGFNCLERLKELEPLQNSIFVMYSTHISEDDCDKALQMGASHCLLKPDNIKILRKQLLSLFNNESHYPQLKNGKF